MADNTPNNGRRRISHYVPDEVADKFDERASKYVALTKQGYFGIVILAGMRAIEEEYDKYFPPALTELVTLVWPDDADRLVGVDRPEVDENG